jgi:hypothetical protein
LLAHNQGIKTAKELARFAWAELSAQNERLRKDGKVLSEAKDNLAELEVYAKQFLSQQLPIFAALRIVSP